MDLATSFLLVKFLFFATQIPELFHGDINPSFDGRVKCLFLHGSNHAFSRQILIFHGKNHIFPW